jgi:hypothetical protein
MKNIEQTVMEPGAPGTNKKVKVSVFYTGEEPYVDEFAPEVPIGTVKRKAMKQFGLEERAADEYALQYEGANLDDKRKVGDIAGKEVTLTLVRVRPQEKGYGRRAD